MGQFIDFNYVKKHADFSAILTHYNLELAGSDDERRCCCPFHDDTRPSMTINLAKGVFHCHAASCGEHGNVLDFVVGMEGEDLRAAAARIGDICQIALAEPGTKTGAARATKKQPKPAAKSAKKRASKKPVTQSEDAENSPLTFSLTLDPDHSYGAARSLSPSVISQFEMGYCSKGLMTGRWCVPIHNANGEVVAYVGRWTADPVPDDTTKYLLPKGFMKERELFNLHRVAGHAASVVVVEGVFDAIRLHGLGIPAVGLLGTSISDEQVALLSAHGFRSAIVMLDSGALKAERKVVHRISREILVRSVALPDGEDPATVSEAVLREQVPVFET